MKYPLGAFLITFALISQENDNGQEGFAKEQEASSALGSTFAEQSLPHQALPAVKNHVINTAASLFGQCDMAHDSDKKLSAQEHLVEIKNHMGLLAKKSGMGILKVLWGGYNSLGRYVSRKITEAEGKRAHHKLQEYRKAGNADAWAVDQLDDTEFIALVASGFQIETSLLNPIAKSIDERISRLEEAHKHLIGTKELSSGFPNNDKDESYLERIIIVKKAEDIAHKLRNMRYLQGVIEGLGRSRTATIIIK